MRKLTTVAAGAGAALAVYIWLVRPWQLRWGATDEEVERAMPGDDVVKRPTFNATRGVTIRARPEEIWPWLVQIGHTRGGFYSYDWLDNFATPSAQQIEPRLQHLERGDMVSVSLGGKLGFWVRDFEPNCWLLFVDKRDEMGWVLALYPLDESRTRLVTRFRVRYAWTKPRMLFFTLLEFADIIMMQRCMLNIKRRAEAAVRR